MKPEKLTRSGLISLVGSAVAALGALVLTSIVGHALGAHGTGLFFQAVGIFTVVTQVLRLGTNSGVVRFIAGERAYDRRGQEWRIALLAAAPVALVSGLAAIGLWLWADELSRWMTSPTGVPELSLLLRMMAPFVVVGAVSGVVHIVARMVRGVASFTMLQSILPAVARLAAVAAALLGLTTAGAAFTAWLLPLPVWLLVGVALIWGPLRDDWRRRRGVDPRDKIGLRRFWTFNGPRAVGSGLETGLQWADVLIVAALTSPSQAGIYAVATRAVRAGEIVDKAMRVAVAPTIARLLARGATDAASQLHARVVRAMVLVGWPFYVVLALQGPAVLAVFGDEFVVGWPILSILAVAMMFQSAAGMLQSVLLQGGRSTWQMYNKAFVLALSIGLNVVLVPRWGIVGAAVSWAAVVLIDNGIAAYQVHRLMRVRLQPRSYLPVAALAVLVFGVGSLGGRLWGDASLGWLLLSTVVSGLAYTAILWWARRGLGIEYLWLKLPLPRRLLSAAGPTTQPSAPVGEPLSAAAAGPGAGEASGTPGSPVSPGRSRHSATTRR